MPTIHTNDSGARAEFKEKLAASVTAAAPVFVSDTPQERVYSIPENWAEISEAALLHTLLHTPDWKYDLSSANYVAAMLYNREPKPDYVSFAIEEVAVSTPVVVIVPEAPKQEVGAHKALSPTEVEKRKSFKSQLLERVSTQPVSPKEDTNRVLFQLPAGYNEMSEGTLSDALLHSEWQYTLDQASYVVAMVFGKTPVQPGTQFSVDSVISESILPVAKRATTAPNKTSRSLIQDPHQERDKKEQFKSQLAARVSSAQLVVPEPEKRARTLFQLPEGYADMTETTLSAALLHNTDWQYDLDTASYVVDMVFGKTAIVKGKFCVGDSEISYEMFPVRKAKAKKVVTASAVTADSTTEKLATEVVTRHQFKAQLSERAAIQPVQPTQPVHEVITVEIPFNFYELSDINLYGHLMNLNPTLLSVNVDDIIRIVRNKDPFTDTKYGFSLGHSVQSEFEIIPQEETHTPIKVIDLLLPYTFEYQRTVDQFTWLRKEAGLGDDDANDVIDFVAGKPVRSNTEFNITYDEVPPPAEFRVPAKKVQAIKPVTEFAAVTLPDGFFEHLDPEERHNFLVREYGLTPEHSLHVLQTQTPEVAPLLAEPVVSLPVEVTLPAEFKSYRPREQYLWLQTKLGPEQAKDVIDIVDGRRESDGYSITFSSAVLLNDNPISKFIQGREEKKPVSSFTKLAKQVKVKEYAPVPVRTLSVQIPSGIAELRSRDQYTYFTGHMQWTPEDANELVAHLAGQETTTVFEIEFTEQ